MLAPEFMAYELRPGLTAGDALAEIRAKLDDLLRVRRQIGYGGPDEDDERFWQRSADAARRRYEARHAAPPVAAPVEIPDAAPAELGATGGIDIGALAMGVDAALKLIEGAAAAASQERLASRRRLEAELMILLLAEDDDD